MSRIRKKTRGLIELERYFQEQEISLEQVAERTKYSINYLRNVMNGSARPNPRFYYIMQDAFPELPAELLRGDNGTLP